MDNKTISEKTGLSAAEVSRMLNRAKYGRGISWRQAVLLSAAFGKNIKWWLSADISEIKKKIHAQ